MLPSSDVVWGRPGGGVREKDRSTLGRGSWLDRGSFGPREKSSRKTRDRDQTPRLRTNRVQMQKSKE